jgi:CRISPR-associated endonuclease/helicase Cas3
LASFTAKWLEEPLAQVTHTWNEDTRAGQSPEGFLLYWEVQGLLPVMALTWRKEAARLARKLLVLQERQAQDWLSNPYVMHLARLSLMLSDHHYSSLPADSPQRVHGNGGSHLFANTDAAGSLKQTLDEHLLGVAKGAGLIAHALPSFARELPALAEHKGLRKRSGPGRFAWQDKATDAAADMRELAQQQGGFIINMASTGCGKTLANARMLYALADPKRGLRAAYALGLRTLTLQTGRSYRQDLQLKDDDLAILVGGSANRTRFDYYEAQSEATGSASMQDLLEEDSHLVYEGDTQSHPLLARALADSQIQRLLLAPLLVCTVDHLAPATESLRAGRQIAPMLRLLSGDLVLDELDDYDLDDLPALTRLVHWAGLLGSRVILSSATLPPALVEGMFAAYRAGRIHHQRNRGTQGEVSEHVAQARLAVPCLWADEFGVLRADCTQLPDHAEQHALFVAQRVAQLAKAQPLRRAELLTLQLASQQRQDIATEFAQPLMQACLRLHKDHAELDPTTSKQVSFGLVRMANVEPLFDTARTLFALDAPEDTRIHLCIYHARFPLLQRSAIEHQLDAVFNRRDPQAVWRLPFIRAALQAPEAHHVFVVLASPVCEVGRDWDASWAVAEPSSMRSLIQLAGRVQRHRSHAPIIPNVLVFDTNLKNFRQTGVAAKDRKAIFLRPGFEANVPLNDPFRLRGNRLGTLLRPQEFEVLTARPRIQPQPAAESDAQRKLVDLEHARMTDGLLPRMARVNSATDLNAASGWQFASAALNGVLPRLQRFRAQTQRMETLVFLPDDDGEALRLHRVEASQQQRGQNLYIPVHDSLLRPVTLTLGQGMSAWGSEDLMALVQTQAEAQDMGLRRCAEKFTVVDVPQSTQGWRHHPWLGFSAQ